MRFTFIRDHAGTWPIRLMCRVLQVSASGYYAWRDRPDSARLVANRHLLGDVRRLQAEHRGRYGSPRMHAALRAEGRTVSRGRVARLMRHHGIRGLAGRRFKPCTTDSRHDLPLAPNLLKQAFAATAPNTVWLADITYITTGEGWLYLAAVLDLATRKIVGWAMRDHMRTELPLAALMMAAQRQRPVAGLIQHSDRGSQYAAEIYRKQLAVMAATPSMSRTGCCYDNAPMESFFHTLKVELVHQCHWTKRDEARRDLFAYIEGYYNVSSEHTSRYVVDAKRLCWATSCSAGCFEDLEDSSASLRAVEQLRSRRLKTQGPSGRGWIALTSPRSAASRRVRGATPTTAAAWLRFSQRSSPSDGLRNTGMR